MFKIIKRMCSNMLFLNFEALPLITGKVRFLKTGKKINYH